MPYSRDRCCGNINISSYAECQRLRAMYIYRWFYLKKTNKVQLARLIEKIGDRANGQQSNLIMFQINCSQTATYLIY